MGLINVRRGKSGAVEYLEKGKKKESEFTRDEKDRVVPVYGSRKSFKQMEAFLNKEKNYKHNYVSATFSFSPKDQKKFEALDESKQLQMMKKISELTIIHHTSGHDLDSEVEALSEWHLPKIKQDISRHGRNKGEIVERLGHCHILIANYNKVSDTQLRTTFANEFMDGVIQAYINNMFELEHPRANSRRNPKVKNKAYYRHALLGIRSYDELTKFLDNAGAEYREVKTNKNHYLKVINGDVTANLNGKDLKHIEWIVRNKTKTLPESMYPQNSSPFPEEKRQDELEAILGDYYQKRIDMIDKRRSKKSKEVIKEIYKDDIQNDNENAIEVSYQAKLFYKHYKHLVQTDLKGYSVGRSERNDIKFVNKQKDVSVYDKGSKVVGYGKNHVEQVKLMLDIAQAKGWKLTELEINGSDEFKAEMEKQIDSLLAKQRVQIEALQKDNPLQKTALMKGIENPSNLTQALAKEHKEKMQTKDLPLSELKQMLRAENVLIFVAERYKVDLSKYEVTSDNKINNLGNKQKPKNVIDFLQKEINLSTKEAILECQALYKDQPLEVQRAEVPMPVQETKPIKLKERKKENEYTKQQQRAIHKHTNRESERGRTTKDNMRKLSDSDLVLNGRKRTGVLLSSDERNRLRSEAETDHGLLSARARDNQAQQREDGGLKMPLHISINKTSQKNALTGWEVVEVQNYTQLATLMKEHSYASSRFDEKRDANNANTFNNLLIFDVDNDPKDKQLTIKEAKELLERKGISALILPSKNHQKEKFTKSGESKGIKDRYRIVIPTSQAIRNNTDKETYEEFQRLTANALGLTDSVDTSALIDKARFYYKSPIEAQPVVAKANKVLDISNLESRAIENIQLARAEKEAQRAKLEEIRANISKYREVSRPTSNNLTYVEPAELLNTPIASLIKNYEGTKEEKEEGSYQYIKTDNAKYSIVEDNVAHDFKSGMTYNSLTYLQMQFETINLNRIARELEKDTGVSYIRVNTEAVKDTVTNTLSHATNDKTFEEAIKKHFECKYCKLGKDSIEIADQTIELKELGIEKIEIINQFKENRKQKELDEEQAHKKGLER